MKKITILALDGLFDSSFTVTLNILSSAKLIHDMFCAGTVAVEVVTCSTRKGRLRTSEGLEFKVEHSTRDIESTDFVIVPGLRVIKPLQMDQLIDSASGQKAISFLRRMYDSGAVLAASCSATFLLAEAGVFEQQTTTTSWWLADAFRAKYPQTQLQTEQMVVTGQQFICAGAAMAQADLMMAVVTDVYGEETARLTASYLLIDRRQFQSQYFHASMTSQRYPLVAKAERWIRSNIDNEFSVQTLADAIGVSTRTLARRINDALGVSPVVFIQQIRVEYAIHFLETSTDSFDTIAGKVGYQDPSSLRRVLSKMTGKTPRQFRSVQ